MFSVVSDAPDDDYDVAYNEDDHDAIYEDLCALRRRVSLQVGAKNTLCFIKLDDDDDDDYYYCYYVVEILPIDLLLIGL